MSVLTALGFIAVLSTVGARVAMLVMSDVIFERPRDTLHDFLQRGPKRLFILQLITCVVCLSVWLAAGLTVATMAVTDVPLPLWVFLGTASGIIYVHHAIEVKDET